jgi:dTDP-glucose pyrophosphorylase
MEAPMLLISVIVLTTVVLWMAAIFAVLEEAKQEPRTNYEITDARPLGAGLHAFAEQPPQ